MYIKATDFRSTLWMNWSELILEPALSVSGEGEITLQKMAYLT